MSLTIPLKVSEDTFNKLMQYYGDYKDFEEVMQDLMQEYIYDRLNEEQE